MDSSPGGVGTVATGIPQHPEMSDESAMASGAFSRTLSLCSPK